MENEEMLRICNEKLVAIAPNVVADDRKAAMMQFDISYMTVLRYLKGGGKNSVLAVDMYNLLNDRIQKRIEVLTA